MVANLILVVNSKVAGIATFFELVNQQLNSWYIFQISHLGYTEP